MGKPKRIHSNNSIAAVIDSLDRGLGSDHLFQVVGPGAWTVLTAGLASLFVAAAAVGATATAQTLLAAGATGAAVAAAISWPLRRRKRRPIAPTPATTAVQVTIDLRIAEPSSTPNRMVRFASEGRLRENVRPGSRKRLYIVPDD